MSHEDNELTPVEIYQRLASSDTIADKINIHNLGDQVCIDHDLRVVDVVSAVSIIDEVLREHDKNWVCKYQMTYEETDEIDKAYRIDSQLWVMVSERHVRSIQVQVEASGFIHISGYSKDVVQRLFNTIMARTQHIRRQIKNRKFITEITAIRKTITGEYLEAINITVRDDTRPKKEFYPAFANDPDFDLDMFIEEYLVSRESVILNYGPPGTGKTTFSTEIARAALDLEGEFWRVFLIKNRMILQRLDLLADTLQRLPSNSLVIIEDLDDLLKPRVGPNGQDDNNPFMATLLNFSDGLDDRNIKFIFNTNQLNLNNIDPALIRPQRRFALIYSGYMDHTQINAAREAAGKPEVDVTPFIGERISLAQALSINTRNSTGSREYGDPVADAKIHEKLALRNKVIEVECLDDLPKEIYPGMRRLVKSLGEIFEQDKTGLWGINKNNRGVAGVDDKDRKREQVALGKSQPQTQTTN